VLAASLLVLAGCRNGDEMSYPPGPTSGGPPHRGGHIVFVREEDPDYLDPALSYGSYSAPLVESIFRTLLEYPDSSGTAGARLVPELAESLPDLREGGTLYAFKVRPDARFGAPLHRKITAEDFKYAFERQFRVGGPGTSFFLGVVGARDMLAGKVHSVAGVIVHGDSIYFRLEKPDPIFPQLIAMTFTAPVPREIDEKYPNAYTQHAVSSGPYEIAEFTPRRRVLLVRNPDYFGEPAWADTFELKLGVTATNSVALIRRGVVDGGIFSVPAGDYARLRRDPFWRQQLEIADGLNSEYLFMNVREKPFDDVRVRQAVCWAIDHRAMVKAINGLGNVAGEFLPPGMPGARRLGRYLGPDGGPDVVRARKLLREAGYPDGFKTKLYGMTPEPVPRMLTLVQQELEDVGIHAELDMGEAVAYTSMAQNVSNHVAFGYFGWYADYVDPSNFFDVLLNGQRIQPTNNLDLSMYDDPVTNTMIAGAMASTDDSTRARRWREIDERVMEAAPVALLVHRYDDRLYAPRLGGWYRHITRILKIDRLYVKQPLEHPLAERR